jgi:hypothetical protein
MKVVMMMVTNMVTRIVMVTVVDDGFVVTSDDSGDGFDDE